MQIRGEGLANDDATEVPREGKVLYVMHPNCAVEDM